MQPKYLVVTTENGSIYQIDEANHRIRKLFRKPGLGKGSRRLVDGKWQPYNAVKRIVEGACCIITWLDGQTLTTSAVKAIIEQGNDYED